MVIAWTKEGWEDYLYWQTHNKQLIKRINALIKETLRTPFEGLGKPEPLKHELSGAWSRRIDQEHRLIYKVDNETIIIIQCRFHY